MPPDIVAVSYEGHISKAVRSDCPLGTDIPLPPDVGESLAWVAKTPDNEIPTFWGSQLLRLRKLARLPELIELELKELIPPELRGPAGNIK